LRASTPVNGVVPIRLRASERRQARTATHPDRKQSVADFDLVEDEILGMADMLSSGITAEFCH
jgi:hypothetical protein